MTQRSGDNGENGTDLTDALELPISAELLTLALTHRSYAYEHGGLPTNERLEFLGDSCWAWWSPSGCTIATRTGRKVNWPRSVRASSTCTRWPTWPAVSARAVWVTTCTWAAAENCGGRDKASILADGLESLFGAMFLDHGLETSREIILAIFGDVIGKAGKLGAGLDWKTSLQELSSERELGPPQYQITSTGPDHDKEFTATAIVGGEGRWARASAVQEGG